MAFLLPRGLSLKTYRGNQLCQDLQTELVQFAQSRLALEEKDLLESLQGCAEISVLRERGSKLLVGFAAFQTMREQLRGRRILLLFARWAVFNTSWAGHNLVHRLAMRCYAKQRLRHPLTPIYGLLAAATHLAYLFLSKNLRCYWPRRHRPTPAAEAALLHRSMSKIAGPAWDGRRGVLQGEAMWAYREGVVASEPHALSDPDVRAYARWNRRQTEGDALTCLIPLRMDNWMYFAKTQLKRRFNKEEASSLSESQS